MDDQARVQQIKQYVLARLREELGSGPRGAQAQLAKSLGVSGAHLSNMLSPRPTRQPGEDFRRKVAAHWGISYAQLEALALGEEPPTSSLQPMPGIPANFALALSGYRWTTELPDAMRSVVREQARQHLRVSTDHPLEEWQRILTGLEREALGLLARLGREGPGETAAKRRRSH